MTALLALALLAASPLPRDFWARELGTMQRDLVELAISTPNAAKDPHLVLWSEALRFATCQPLDWIDRHDTVDPRRLLLRVEARRLARLGPAAASEPTLWRDLLDPTYLNRALPPVPEAGLVWRAEKETWPNEHLVVEPLTGTCSAPRGAAGSELDEIRADLPDLLVALGPGYVPTAHRLAYHRAVLAYGAGKPQLTRESLRFLNETLLPQDLRPFVALLRLETEGGDGLGYLALLDDPQLAPQRRLLAVRAATYLARTSPPAFLAFSEEPYLESLGIVGLDDALARYVAALRATALERTRDRDARARFAERVIARGAAPLDANDAILEEYALAELARLPAPFAMAALERYAPASLFIPRATRVAGFAMTMRRFDLVDRCAARLEALGDPRGRLRALALVAESALLQDQPGAFLDATRRLLDSDVVPRVWLPERDAVFGELLTGLATHAASLGSGAWMDRVESLARDALEKLSSRNRPRIEQATRVLAQATRAGKSAPVPKEGALVLAFGAAEIHPNHPPPQEPSLTFSFPEPFSLLALPNADGEVLAWFPNAEPERPEVPRAP